MSVLIETELEAPAPLLASQSPERLEQALAELWAKVESMGYGRFKTDVVPYLPPETAAAVTEEAYEEMQVNVGTNVEQWLEDARELQKRERVENVKPERPGAR